MQTKKYLGKSVPAEVSLEASTVTSSTKDSHINESKNSTVQAQPVGSQKQTEKKVSITYFALTKRKKRKKNVFYHL